MTVYWYNVGNRTEFERKGIPQEAKEIDLEDMGKEEVVFVSGFNFSVIFKGEFLTPKMNGRNPFYRNKASAYIDPKTSEIWVGYENNM